MVEVEGRASRAPISHLRALRAYKLIDFFDVSCDFRFMSGKTITLDLDAYRRLRASKRPGETFSSVVRRAIFRDSAPTGEDLLKWTADPSDPVPEKYLAAVEEAAAYDAPPDDPWS